MGFFTNILKNVNVRSTSERILKEVGVAIDIYKKSNPQKTLPTILKEREFHQSLIIRDLHGNFIGSAENLITPLPDHLKHRENEPLALVFNIVCCIVNYEMSYDATMGKRSDIEAIYETVSKNMNKYIKT
ncbi:Uncharacterized protein dnl_64330 [Desulfonema limicola]|uniref:Uncharacterized protein n=1 Tax=Desulfonema limicola TaxID=45656 RepID=A0A975BEP4_9BACT|nr:hypothetical protein [Desulfonema limicola]QTA84002.1 Uncharacterized protein dnl_64330 [Desulfonema limicola]